MIEVTKLDLDSTKRSIVITDIHASLKLFKQLLEKVNYIDDDYLFINGDLCEKGPNSLEVVRFVRALKKKSEHVFVTKGNCDVIYRPVFDGMNGITGYMKKQRYSILNEMMEKHGKTLEDFPNLEKLAAFYRLYFQQEIEWLESLPVAYETADHIMIHAGIDNHDNWLHTEESVALSVPSFYELCHQAGKPVIVGHWPVVNYRTQQVCSNNPLIDLDKRVIALDGGNQIKRDGQLNALIIENGHYSYTYVDELTEEASIKKNHTDSTGRIGTVTYPNYELEIIGKEEYFTLCEIKNLGIKQWVKNEYIASSEGKVCCTDDLSTTFLSVAENEKVWVIENKCAGYTLVKNSNGEVGWVPDDCFE
ncbi:metallophosphoesterase [Oceanobacillus saliphilus]|uniref:metallophosphoesterase n=1 Tax=Oceanobacillus saliphilus TaxID=2925834 RepID=UPI00201DC0FF